MFRLGFVPFVLAWISLLSSPVQAQMPNGRIPDWQGSTLVPRILTELRNARGNTRPREGTGGGQRRDRPFFHFKWSYADTQILHQVFHGQENHGDREIMDREMSLAVVAWEKRIRAEMTDLREKARQQPVSKELDVARRKFDIDQLTRRLDWLASDAGADEFARAQGKSREDGKSLANMYKEGLLGLIYSAMSPDQRAKEFPRIKSRYVDYDIPNLPPFEVLSYRIPPAPDKPENKDEEEVALAYLPSDTTLIEQFLSIVMMNLRWVAGNMEIYQGIYWTAKNNKEEGGRQRLLATLKQWNLTQTRVYHTTVTWGDNDAGPMELFADYPGYYSSGGGLKSADGDIVLLASLFYTAGPTAIYSALSRAPLAGAARLVVVNGGLVTVHFGTEMLGDYMQRNLSPRWQFLVPLMQVGVMVGLPLAASRLGAVRTSVPGNGGFTRPAAGGSNMSVLGVEGGAASEAAGVARAGPARSGGADGAGGTRSGAARPAEGPRPAGAAAASGGTAQSVEEVVAQQNLAKIKSDEFSNLVNGESVGGNAGSGHLGANAAVDGSGKLLMFSNYLHRDAVIAAALKKGEAFEVTLKIRVRDFKITEIHGIERLPEAGQKVLQLTMTKFNAGK